MKECTTPAELLKRWGEPAWTREEDDVDIWHYPLREIGGTVYSIHVAFIDGKQAQAYLHMETARAG